MLPGFMEIPALMHMQVGRHGVTAHSQCRIIGVKGIGMNFQMGVDQGEKQGELPTAGVHDGDGRKRRRRVCNHQSTG